MCRRLDLPCPGLRASAPAGRRVLLRRVPMLLSVPGVTKDDRARLVLQQQQQQQYLHRVRRELSFASSRVVCFGFNQLKNHRRPSSSTYPSQRPWAPHGFSKAPFPLAPLPFPPRKVLCPAPAVPQNPFPSSPASASF
jgi:hypothetical protein